MYQLTGAVGSDAAPLSTSQAHSGDIPSAVVTSLTVIVYFGSYFEAVAGHVPTVRYFWFSTVNH